MGVWDRPSPQWWCRLSHETWNPKPLSKSANLTGMIQCRHNVGQEGVADAPTVVVSMECAPVFQLMRQPCRTERELICAQA